MNDTTAPFFGAKPLADGRTAFRLWAPAQRKVEVETADGRRFDMQSVPGGWFEATLPLGAGTDYFYRVEQDDGTLAIPDPASRAQADDVHGPSRVVDPSSYRWRCPGWRGRPWAEAVIYELHVGLLVGFAGVEAKLPELAELGITAVELMPVADFPGPRNWGYDGVLPYAPDTSYGTPDDLRRLVDRAHELGLMIFLDVVYNHFGPDGNYLGLVAPDFFRGDLKTPWGAAIDFRRPEVRAFFTNNAVEWIRDYRFDGLRLDAVHAISEADWLDEMALAVRTAAGVDRHVHLVVENENNVADRLAPDPRRFDAQWNDDAHHVLHVLLTGTREGYYVDYADAPAERLARVLAEGFAYQGDPSIFRDGAPRGTRSDELPPTAFIDALQNHDQIGNRAFGDRLVTLADPDALRAAVVLQLMSPHVPLLFMGEEAGSRTPFLFFTSHEESLAELVRNGRRAEFAGFEAFADPAARERIPDPNDPATFERSRPQDGPGADVWRTLYRELLQLRRRELAPRLPGTRSCGAHALGPAAVTASWTLGDGSTLVVAVNLGPDPVAWRQAPDARHRLHGVGRIERGQLAGHAAAAYLLPPLDDGLRELAEAVGVQLEWQDFEQRRHTLGRDTVVGLLGALGCPAATPEAIAASLARLEDEALPALLTARVGERIELPLAPSTGGVPGGATLTLESGSSRRLRVERHDPPRPGGAPRWSLEPIDEPGYHRIELGLDGRTQSVGLAIAPPQAWQAPGPDERCWGTAVQLHALRPEAARTADDVGLGDYGALASLASVAGARGAQALAVSPTHAGFAADPACYSPYSPSSRLATNVFYLDPGLPFGADAAASARRRADLGIDATALVDEPLIDWPRAGTAKLRWLRALFDAHAAEIEAAAADRPADPRLRQHADFEALDAHFRAGGHHAWTDWPEPYRNPDTPEVREFVAAHPREIAFHLWLQHCAAEQLAWAQAAARDAGMRIGLIADLAIGMSPVGSHAWAARADLLMNVQIGAPPDKFNLAGQGWGLAAFSPRALQRRAFEPFLATLRLAMQHAGGVRIDHVLGLQRLWLVPEGAAPGLGGYLRYPLRDLLNLVILESHRHRAIVIGEDLGTVPAGFRELLADAGIRGMEVLWFQRPADDAGFIDPAAWSASAIAMTTTHDLPTAQGWWQGRDLEWREQVGSEHDPAGARLERAKQRAELAALAAAPAGGDSSPGGTDDRLDDRGDDRPDDGSDGGSDDGSGDISGDGSDGGSDDSRDGVDLAITVVARSPAPLVLVPLEDLLGLVEQPNLPGTTDQHPNWRRRLPLASDRLFDDPAVAAHTARLGALRPD